MGYTFILIILITILSPQMGYSCTMYKITKHGKTIVGNNEDYLSPNSQFWFEDFTTGKYGVMYMGQLDNFAQGAVNEKGLMFDGFYVPYLAITNTEGKAVVPIDKGIRNIMQTMSNVGEVKSYLDKINLSSLTNSMLVFVDKSGAYLIVEGDEMIIGKESEKSFSNFYYSQTNNLNEVNKSYFQNGLKFLNASNKKGTLDYCGEVMNHFAQKKSINVTQYSTIYDLNVLIIRVYLFHDYSQFVEIDLKKELKKGNHKKMIAELFPKESIGYKHYLAYNNVDDPTLMIKETIGKEKISEEELKKMDFSDDVNTIGYEWLKQKQNSEAAIKIFEYAINLMPNNADLYDSLGEAYFENNDWDNSIKNYEKSLSLYPENKNAAEMLIKIREKTDKPNTKLFNKLTNLINQYAENEIKKGNINSIALAIYKNGAVFHNYYGEIDRNNKNKPNDSTLYEIASISKVFVGSLAAKAMIEKRIKLDDDIRTYMVEAYPNLEYQGTPITIKDLLTHTLGFKTKIPEKLAEVNKKVTEGYYENRPFDYNMSTFLKELKTVELDKKPGTFYDYNSIGSELMAYILEQVYHKPYKDLLQIFLNELDMKNTYLNDYQQHKKYLVNGYTSTGALAPIEKNPLLGGGYGIITTLPDLMKLMKFQLESDNPLIKESTKILFEDDQDNVMGYLWQDMGIGKEEGFYYSKTGDTNGVRSGILISPDSKYGQIVIINNKSDLALNDWEILFNKIETDLIKYPKLNLKSVLKSQFIADPQLAKKSFDVLSKQKESYFNTNLQYTLNSLGYDLLYSDKEVNKAIKILEFATKEYPDSANLFDSLGEAYFVNKEYKKAILNYKKSLKLNPNNDTAKKHISEINKLKSNT
ncbi:MAG: serine hydrolase [Chryseobacterium jejuense]|uniref:serine hydrolase n=1 Tax=Chryseobacterium jejuense TaxID=445960 RepID=UPI003D14CF89